MEIGVGFHPDLTGRENVYTSGIVSGLTKREVDLALHSIVEFAELEQSIDRPVRTYSTGMYMRLAFALAVHVEQQILLIDEVLAVGDQNFQRKCLDRIYKIRDQLRTIVIVSHDLGTLAKLCDRVCWLERGRVRQTGIAEEVIETYLTHTNKKESPRFESIPPGHLTRGPQELKMGENRWGSLRVVIDTVTLRNAKRERRDLFEAGQSMEIQLHYRCQTSGNEPIFQATICRADGMKCIETDTSSQGSADLKVSDVGILSLSIDRLELGEGTYTLSVGAYSADWLEIFDYQWQAYSFEVFSTSRYAWRTESSMWDLDGRSGIGTIG
jgi:ABC-type multidrug transport system ATPase subunit